MKAQFLDRSTRNNESITLKEHSGRYFKRLWHYHPEIELMTVQEGFGSIFVGDSVERFSPGTIVLIGGNLPHLWQNDKCYFDPESDLKVRSYSIHFHEDFAGSFFSVPEMYDIQQLLLRCVRGLEFYGPENEKILTTVLQMFRLSGYERLLSFIQVLKSLADRVDCSVLSSLGYVNNFSDIQDTKMVLVHEYIMNNFKEEIELSTLASIASMNPSYFSRYFSSVQKKTVTEFINEIRIGYACKLIISGKHSITNACYESGFKNISNFNRQFLKIKKMSPSQYCKLRQPLRH